MSASVNKAIVIGNIGRDPELRSTQDGRRVASFSVATSESWRDKGSGERKERTQWHNIVVFNDKLVEVVEKYVRKGSKIYVEGAMQTRKWADKSGFERYTTEIVLQQFRGQIALMDGAPESGGRPPAADSADAYGTTSDRPYSARHDAPVAETRNDPDDDIPF